MWNLYLADVDAGVLLIVRPVAQRQAELLLAVLPAQLHLLQPNTTCFPFGRLDRPGGALHLFTAGSKSKLKSQTLTYIPCCKEI